MSGSAEACDRIAGRSQQAFDFGDGILDSGTKATASEVWISDKILIQSEVLPHSGVRTDSPARQGGEGIVVLRRVNLTPQADLSGAPAGLASRRVWTALAAPRFGGNTPDRECRNARKIANAQWPRILCQQL